jgi:hypothetical protein
LHEEKNRLNFEEQAACWNNQDVKDYSAACAPDQLIQTAERNGITYGHEKIIANYKRSFPKASMGNLSFDHFKLRKLDDQFYHVTGRYNLKFKGTDDLSQGWFSATVEKIHRKWYMITDHSS